MAITRWQVGALKGTIRTLPILYAQAHLEPFCELPGTLIFESNTSILYADTLVVTTTFPTKSWVRYLLGLSRLWNCYIAYSDSKIIVSRNSTKTNHG